MGMEATLAAVTNLWCNEGSEAMRVKKSLKTNLQRGIEEIQSLKHEVITINQPTVGAPPMCTVIRVENPCEDLNRECTTTTAYHTDVQVDKQMKTLSALWKDATRFYGAAYSKC